jgi:DNA-binding MarR family transcriptional regulator
MIQEDLRQRVKLWLSMLRTTRHVEHALRERIKEHFGSTLPRFDVMAALYRNPEGISMTRLSELLVVSNGNVTGIVDRLESEGLVVRVIDDRDRRAARVALTEDGSAVFARMAAAHEAWIAELFDALPAEDVDLLLERLEPLRASQRRTETARPRKRKEAS